MARIDRTKRGKTVGNEMHKIGGDLMYKDERRLGRYFSVPYFIWARTSEPKVARERAGTRCDFVCWSTVDLERMSKCERTKAWSHDFRQKEEVYETMHTAAAIVQLDDFVIGWSWK